jgi:probable rRNA maturation factor
VLEIIDETQQFRQRPTLEAVLSSYLDELGIDQTVTVILCDDVQMRELNFEHRGIDDTTDVLSYPMMEPDDANMPWVEQLGDVFISVDTAQRQADQHGLTLLEEVLRLAAHGITHLRGFDHPTEDAWQTFHNAQNTVLALYRAAP